jgi:hypothetical protein
MKYAFSRRPVLNINLSEMGKCRGSFCFHYMLVLQVRKESHDQNLSYISFKYSVLRIDVGWQMQLTGADQVTVYSKSTDTQTQTERPTEQYVDRATFIFITGGSTVLLGSKRRLYTSVSYPL